MQLAAGGSLMTFELAHEAFAAIANFTYDWETWVGPAGKVRWVNPAVERITGYTPAECQQMPDYPLPLVHEADRDKVREALAGAAEGTTGNDLEFRVRHKSGETRWAAVSWQPLVSESGAALGYRTSIRDISARKATEERLRLALRQAEEAERTRRALLANVSHELRTPIHNLIGYTKLIARTELDDKQRKWNGVVAHQAEVLRVLVNDLLDLAAGEAGVVQDPQLFDLAQLISKTVEAQRVAIEQKALALEVSLQLSQTQIFGDAKATAQIIRNLVDNARKYTDSGRIEVSVSLPEGAKEIVITISDTGIGMDPARLTELREPFRRADDSRARRQEGVGLGLAIVDRLCQRLGGSMELESSLDSGTTAIVRLPAQTTLDREHAQPEQEPLALSGLAVLVVDDLEAGRQLAVELLKQLGCGRVDAAKDAREALAMSEKNAYGLVLMDLHMPDLDGVAAAHLIRARAHGRQPMPRIVAMTADVFSQDVALEAFDGYLGKPVDERALVEILKSAVAGHCRESAGTSSSVALDPQRLEELQRARTRSGETFFQRFAGQAQTQLAPQAALLQTTAREQLRELTRQVHDVKGAADLIGARDLARLAADAQATLEDAARSCAKLPAAIQGVIETIKKEL
jgi:PAS domain S-box-containing protein